MDFWVTVKQRAKLNKRLYTNIRANIKSTISKNVFISFINISIIVSGRVSISFSNSPFCSFIFITLSTNGGHTFSKTGSRFYVCYLYASANNVTKLFRFSFTRDIEFISPTIQINCIKIRNSNLNFDNFVRRTTFQPRSFTI